MTEKMMGMSFIYAHVDRYIYIFFLYTIYLDPSNFGKGSPIWNYSRGFNHQGTQRSTLSWASPIHQPTWDFFYRVAHVQIWWQTKIKDSQFWNKKHFHLILWLFPVVCCWLCAHFEEPPLIMAITLPRSHALGQLVVFSIQGDQIAIQCQRSPWDQDGEAGNRYSVRI